MLRLQRWSLSSDVVSGFLYNCVSQQYLRQLRSFGGLQKYVTKALNVVLHQIKNLHLLIIICYKFRRLALLTSSLKHIQVSEWLLSCSCADQTASIVEMGLKKIMSDIIFRI